MADFINDNVNVSNGNNDGCYNWLSIKSGIPSRFRLINLCNTVYYNEIGRVGDCYFFTGNNNPAGPFDAANPNFAYSITNNGTFSFKLEGNRSSLINSTNGGIALDLANMKIINNTGNVWPAGANARILICGEVYNTSAPGVVNETIEIGFIINAETGAFAPNDTTRKVQILNVPTINVDDANPLLPPISFQFKTTAGFQIPNGEFIKIVCRNITTPANVPVFVNLFVLIQDNDFMA